MKKVAQSEPIFSLYLYHNIHREKPQAREPTPIGVLPSLFMVYGGGRAWCTVMDLQRHVVPSGLEIALILNDMSSHKSIIGQGKLSVQPMLSLWAGIFKQSMKARNQVGIGLSYGPARLHRLAEFIPWNRFLGSVNIQKYGLRLSPPPPPNRWDHVWAAMPRHVIDDLAPKRWRCCSPFSTFCRAEEGIWRF